MHIWELAKKITTEKELQKFGRNILQLPEYEITSVMHSKKYALAAREILELWRKNQVNPEEAYNSLTAALGNAGWSQLAEQLRSWAEGGKDV